MFCRIRLMNWALSTLNMWASKPANSGLVVEFAEISADVYMEYAYDHD